MLPPTFLPALTVALLLFVTFASAYIPAVAVNDTSLLNLLDDSNILLRYLPSGSAGGIYSASVSYQLRADVATGGVDLGALVHFTESGQGPNLTTPTPWIAFISCDKNETGASEIWDIFTLARDRGAVAAVLYTTTAMACLINEDYIQNFEKPVDVFAAKSRSSAALLEGQFSNTDSSFWSYNGTLLNASETTVNQSLTSTSVPTRTYLLATLTARNSTGQAYEPPVVTATPSATSAPTQSPGKSTAMIVLYTMVALFVSLFGGVIILGAIRAIRYPERYGPRAFFDDEGAPQTQLQGLTRAVLDTFPVIKFSRATPSSTTKSRAAGRAAMAYPTYDKQLVEDGGRGQQGNYMGLSSLKGPSYDAELSKEPGGYEEELPVAVLQNDPRHRLSQPSGSRESSFDRRHRKQQSSNAHHLPTDLESDLDSFHSAQAATPTSAEAVGGPGPEIAAAARALAAQRASMTSTQGGEGRKRESRVPPPKGETLEEGDEDVDGAAGGEAEEHRDGEGEESCPICLLEFEDGDDVRVLPCEMGHSYHQACIDPWLLEVSSSCPLCRRDFNAPQPPSPPSTPRNRTTSNPSRLSASSPLPASGSAGSSRFGRYLAFVRRERRRSAGGTAAAEEGDEGEEGGGGGRWGGGRRRRHGENEQSGPGGY